MSYPASSDVTDGQPTSYLHYNTLRADALYFGGLAADNVTPGAGLARYADNLVLEPLATNRLRVPYNALWPCVLMIDGHLCKAAADVDLAALTFSGAAATWYIFANWTAGSTTFTLSANTSLTEAAGQRRIAMINWDGANVLYPTLIVYHGGRPGLYYARVRRAANQALNDSTAANLSFDTEDVDNDGMYTSGAPTRITIVHPGFYLITANVTYSSDVDGYRRTIILLNNAAITTDTHTGAIAMAVSAIVTTVRHLAAADYLEVQLYHTAGNALNITGEFNVIALSA
jgi:hypothetical protein